MPSLHLIENPPPLIEVHAGKLQNLQTLCAKFFLTKYTFSRGYNTPIKP